VHLKTPDHVGPSPGSSKDPSEVSDAGHQLGLRYKRKPSVASEQTKSASGRRASVRASSSNGSQYELQKNIISAFKRTQTSHGQSQEFLPEGDLYKLINPLSVGQELRNSLGQMHTLTSIDSFTRKICGETQVLWGGKRKIRTYRKIFALLVIVGTTASTPFFLEKAVSDLNLPLQPLPPGDDNNYGTAESIDALDYFEDLNWSPIQVRTFQEYQWKMLAPFFAKGKHGDVIHYPLLEQHILPFLSTSGAERNAEKSGGFARVAMVRIHEAHHDFHEIACTSGFAVKQQLHVHDKDTFKKEIAVLKKFSGDGRGHKHIISLLATFEQFDKLNLLFYRAEGDLFAYWNHVPSLPNSTYDNIQWVAEQCEGLMEALLRVHRHLTFTNKLEEPREAPSRRPIASKNAEQFERPYASPQKKVKFGTGSNGPENSTILRSKSDSSFGPLNKVEDDKGLPVKQYGRHGDINPGNILWFNECDSRKDALGGTLKIADFGQAEFNSLKSRTAPRDVANTLTYRPPECDRLVRNEQPLIRQRYDIWCMGCVFLEFMTWVLGGEQLQTEFAASRLTPDFFENQRLTDTFFQVRRNVDSDCHEIIVKPEVIEVIPILPNLLRTTDD
jgi:serine/threonine protein kinase